VSTPDDICLDPEQVGWLAEMLLAARDEIESLSGSARTVPDADNR
jgi:hypothetical protein